MAAIPKPVNLSLTWASGGDILNPGDTKYATGWNVEIPPRQWFNYLDNRQDEAIAHINQYGLAVWDADTEYQYEALGEKSIVMGSDGIIYRTLDTNTNQDPTTTIGVHWEIAFADTGAFYTKVESDANYLAKSHNLADLPNSATARTNLSVYAKAEIYTKGEVDSKTTVASAAQAQALTSNTTLLTPLRLAEAFQGVNRSFSASGFQRLPSGFLIQWGASTTTISAEGSLPAVTLSVAFPSSCVSVQAIGRNTGPNVSKDLDLQLISRSTTQFQLFANNLSGGTQSLDGYDWIAIGF